MLYLNGILKENNAVFTIIPTKVWFAKPLDVKPARPKPIDRNLLREIYIQNLIEIDDKEKDSIKIEIWDNEQVDGDVISLYENDSLILHNQKLESSHLVVYMSVNKANAISKLILTAESEGSVPPCTAHMLVTTSLKHYDIDLSSNSRRNGCLEFFLKE
jgi:hypothetical protein